MKEQERRLRQAGRSRAKLHDERLKKINENKTVLTPRRYNNVGEAEVVPGFQLSAILKRWITAYLADRPLGVYASGEQPYGAMPEFMGPIQLLAERSGLNVRRVSGICNGEFDVVSLSQADSILAATGVGLTYYERTDEITIVPNPTWSLEKWLEWKQGCT